MTLNTRKILLSFSVQDDECSHENYFNQHERKGANVDDDLKILTSDCINKRLELLELEERQISIIGEVSTVDFHCVNT